MTETTVTMSVVEFDRMRDEIKDLNAQLDNIHEELVDAIENHIPLERRQHHRTGYSLISILTDEIKYLTKKE